MSAYQCLRKQWLVLRNPCLYCRHLFFVVVPVILLQMDDNAATDTISITISLFMRIDVVVTYFLLSISVPHGRVLFVGLASGRQFFCDFLCLFSVSSLFHIIHVGWKWKNFKQGVCLDPTTIIRNLCVNASIELLDSSI